MVASTQSLAMASRTRQLPIYRTLQVFPYSHSMVPGGFDVTS